MLGRDTVLEIRRLLDADEFSNREIARRLGVSRGTVNAIATGRRGLHGREVCGPQQLDLFATRPTRCQRCGGMIYAPCLLCQAREYRERQAAIAAASLPRQRVA